MTYLLTSPVEVKEVLFNDEDEPYYLCISECGSKNDSGGIFIKAQLGSILRDKTKKV
jgi:hypothetical protein